MAVVCVAVISKQVKSYMFYTICIWVAEES